MHFRGGGIGHKNELSLDERLLADRNIVENDNTWQDDLFKDFLDDNPDGEGEDPPVDVLIVSLLSGITMSVPPATNEPGTDGNGNGDSNDDGNDVDDNDGLQEEDFA